jgi:Lrp/AsnC family leucine-responsive transcriptional regulator
MDTLDKKILAALQANARASLQDIGAAVGLSASPCWARIKKMEEAGVIEGYTVRLNPQALGLADSVLVMVTLDSHSDNTLEKFGEVLATIPEVVEAHLVSGEYDYLLRIVVKDTRDYERLLREKLYKIKGIRHSQSSFVLRTLKKLTCPWACEAASLFVVRSVAARIRVAGSHSDFGLIEPGCRPGRCRAGPSGRLRGGWMEERMKLTRSRGTAQPSQRMARRRPRCSSPRQCSARAWP